MNVIRLINLDTGQEIIQHLEPAEKPVPGTWYDLTPMPPIWKYVFSAPAYAGNWATYVPVGEILNDEARRST